VEDIVKRIEKLRRACEDQQRALDQATREIARSRAKRWYLLGAGLLFGVMVAGVFAYQVFQAIAQGYLLDCPRFSTLNCHRLLPGDVSYWVGMVVRIGVSVLFLSAAVAMAVFMRALTRPAPVLQMMRQRLQRLQADLEALEGRE